MNNHTHSPLPFLMIAVLLLTSLMASVNVARAQIPMKSETNLILNTEESQAVNPAETRFTADVYEGIVYLKWNMKGDMTNTMFLVERSVNGGDFVTIGHKEGIAAPNPEIVLLYCFKDPKPEAGNNAYRIKQLIDSDNIMSGHTVNVTVQSVSPLAQKDE